MADAIVSAVAEQLIAIIKEQIQNEIHLVRGVDKEVLNLSDELKSIRYVLDDAENRRFKDDNINSWLSRLEQTSYEMEDVLDEWNYALLKLKIENDQSINDAVVVPPKRKVCSFIPSSCLCFKKIVVRHDIAKKIKNLQEQLDQILKEKDRYNFITSQPNTDSSPKSWRVPSTSLVDLAEIHGRVSDRDILVSKLMSNSGSQQELGLLILSIVGVGGLGKTTLAQLLYNDSRVKECFELRIWVCVSDPFDEAGIAKGIIESIEKGSSPNTNQLNALFEHLRDSISGKKFLLVLDDVWTHQYEKWEPLINSLKHGGVGSKILVTTRNERVAKIMGTMDNDIHRLGQLSDEDCWLLLRRMALCGRGNEEFEQFEDIGKKIAKKCNGLPLAAKTLGSLLCFKNTLEEWENVLNSELWEMKEARVDLFPHLLLSYNELSPALKRCFSYCAVHPKDSTFNVRKLIGSWMALGYLGSNIGEMELKGQECFDVLAMRSLFQDFKKDYLDREIKSCKMHDIVHDFAQFLRRSGRVEAAGMNKTTCQACDPLLVSTVNEFCSLFWERKESPPNLCSCLARLRVLSLRGCRLQSIPRGMENLIHLRWLNLRGNKLSHEDLKIIFQLYNLQKLCLRDCSLEKIPREIGNLFHLRHLNLSVNNSLKELPESIFGLHELRTLKVQHCSNLSRLPEGIHRLINLKHLFNWDSHGTQTQLLQGVAHLTGLRTLDVFRGGSGMNKLGWLKKLNRLSGSLSLRLILTTDCEEVVEDALEAELRNKIHIQDLDIVFEDEMDEKESSSSVRMDVIDALEPHPKLRNLTIWNYKGSRLPGWTVSILNQLREFTLYDCIHLTSLPPLGKLPCLEEIVIRYVEALQFLGREFLGLPTATTKGGGDILDIESSSSCAVTAFPKLKKLTILGGSNWEEWEDITAEEEKSAAISIMPCLTELVIEFCESLTALPHRLLRKAPLLKKLEISRSTQLIKRYRNTMKINEVGISEHTVDVSDIQMLPNRSS